MNDEPEDAPLPPGTLRPGEPHPAAYPAFRWIEHIPLADKMLALASFNSCAIEGNRIAEVCAETLRRLLAGEPVSDRYLLGLAWMLREMEDAKTQTNKTKQMNPITP